MLTHTPVAEAPGSSLLNLYPGYLAPATDRRGLITDGRITDILLGRQTTPEPVAIDFAGNRDGHIDVADVITVTQRLVP